MRTRQLVSVWGLVFGAAAALGACGGSGTPAAAIDGGGTGGTAGTGGGAGGMGGRPSLAMCGESGNTCTKAQMDEYDTCLANKCESAYKACIGDNWRTGQYGGACGTWFMCTSACGCNNLNCFAQCGAPPAACQTCLMTAGQCQMTMCPQPACYSTKPDAGTTPPGTDGGVAPGGTCDDLKKCCDGIAVPEFKATCTSVANSGMMDQCSQTLGGLKAAMICK